MTAKKEKYRLKTKDRYIVEVYDPILKEWIQWYPAPPSSRKERVGTVIRKLYLSREAYPHKRFRLVHLTETHEVCEA